MPIYDYVCVSCGEFSVSRAIAERDRPAPCPCCHEPGERMVTAPNLSLMNPARRQAHQTNEKSRHEPRVGGGHRCGSGCGCGSGSASESKRGGSRPVRKGPRRVEVPKLGKFETSARRSSRPWMLGH